MSDYAARIRAELKVRCIHLRTKAAFFPLPGKDEEEPAVSCAIWWCERTTEALGPDGSAARPAACDAPGRRCYEPPDVHP